MASIFMPPSIPIRETALWIGEEAVAYAAYGDQVVGVGGVVFNVAAETDDEVIDGAGVGVFVDAPDLFEDLFTGDDLALAVGEVAEEVGLHEGEMGDAVGSDELEGVEADSAVVEGVFVLWFRGGGNAIVRRRLLLRCGAWI